MKQSMKQCFLSDILDRVEQDCMRGLEKDSPGFELVIGDVIGAYMEEEFIKAGVYESLNDQEQYDELMDWMCDAVLQRVNP